MSPCRREYVFRATTDMEQKKVKYLLTEEGSFIIENYNFSKPFSSFFPGIAGLYGIPMWIFFVNRGQGICSFGTNSKDHSILEFLPANKAYQQVFTQGFRTFLKVTKQKDALFYEPFSDSFNNAAYERDNRMVVDCAELALEEHNRTLGLRVSADYFTIPGDTFAALVRTLTIRNTSSATKEFELIDGLPAIIPYGASNMFLKKLSRTIEAWMGVENLGRRAAFYRLKVDPTDRPEVIHIKKGNFYLSFCKDHTTTRLLSPIVDPACIFGTMGDLTIPHQFLSKRSYRYPSEQIVQCKTPCAFSFVQVSLKKNETFTLFSLFGNMEHLTKLNTNVSRIASVDYINAKRKENKSLLSPLLSSIATVSSSHNFNLYAERTFLDNVLRGGFPITLNNEHAEVVYVFSRKHGDLERDYNKFVTEPTYFSQGNGNFRDVNQNRRNDIFFNPDLGAANVTTFFNLIQLDGFNPLVVKGTSYHIADQVSIAAIIDHHVEHNHRHLLQGFLLRPFRIGTLFMFLEEHKISIKDKTKFITEVLAKSIRHEQAEHKEGFWIDHWTYNLDLLESFIAVFPEKLKSLLCDEKVFTFYDDCWVVNPRHKKYVLYDGLPKQLHAVGLCREKQQLIDERQTEPNAVRSQNGRGDVYRTTLLEKIVCIIVNKLASLDPFGIGIEMEANKPGWYDALNGLPALFGSSSCETMELKRWIMFLQNALGASALGENGTFEFADEIVDFCNGMDLLLKGALGDSHGNAFAFWDSSNTLKEAFRKKTIFGLSGQRQRMGSSELMQFLGCALQKVETAIAASKINGKNAYATYFINEVVRYERIAENKEGIFIKPLEFRQKPLALFLEGFVHALKITDSVKEKKALYLTVKKSGLYDARLGMYKVNASLGDEPEELGRCRVFTPGWLENESVWVHMEYKYLVELLSAGLCDEFYDEFFKLLIPFQDCRRYGRSILENSSFIVSSVFPDKELHGNGFVARLSGSTCEFIHMWLLMNVGENPFFIDASDKLALRLRPALPKELFTKKRSLLHTGVSGSNAVAIEKDCYAFNFLGSTLVVYHNPKRQNTYGKNAVSVKKVVLENKTGKFTTLNSAIIPHEYAYAVRAKAYARIDAHLA